MAGTGIIVRADGEGEKRWFYGGGLHTWKATAEETNGAFLLFEDHMEEGKMTPFHTHPDADEVFYVLEGELVDGAEGLPGDDRPSWSPGNQSFNARWAECDDKSVPADRLGRWLRCRSRNPVNDWRSRRDGQCS